MSTAPHLATTTLFLLLAEYGTGQIPLDRCCGRFGLSADEAKRLAARQQLPVPVFRLGSQKSPWLVSADELAKYIDDQRAEATRLHQQMQRAS